MTCPKCQAAMRQYERSGVTVDQCTECRGIFLDRGELERLIDAEQAWASAPPTPQGAPYATQHQPRYESGSGHRPYKKRKSFLSELFDD